MDFTIQIIKIKRIKMEIKYYGRGAKKNYMIFDELENILSNKMNSFPKPINIIYNQPYTIVEFDDGDKVVVKCNNEIFDKEKGVAMAIIKKLYNNRQEFTRWVENGKEFVPKNKKKIEKEECEIGEFPSKFMKSLKPNEYQVTFTLENDPFKNVLFTGIGHLEGHLDNK
jgi:hypothetical protein